MARSAAQKLAARKQLKKVALENDFADIRAGQCMLVATPQRVDDYIRRVPFGEVRSIRRFRKELAHRHGCDAACPVSTAVFLRMAAEAALESLKEGTPVSDIAPFWRVVALDDKVVAKLAVDSAWIRHQESMEESA